MQNHHKIALIGDSGSGKSSLLRVLRGEDFIPEIQGTVGVDILQVTQVIRNLSKTFKIFDTSGCRIYEPIVNRIISQVDAVIICFDSNADDWEQQISYWKSLVECELRTIPIFLMANKIENHNLQFNLPEMYYVSAKQPRIVKENFTHIFTKLCYPKTKLPLQFPPEQKQSSFLLCCTSDA